jgi:hypothetical protein
MNLGQIVRTLNNVANVAYAYRRAEIAINGRSRGVSEAQYIAEKTRTEKALLSENLRFMPREEQRTYRLKFSSLVVGFETSLESGNSRKDALKEFNNNFRDLMNELDSSSTRSTSRELNVQNNGTLFNRNNGDIFENWLRITSPTNIEGSTNDQTVSNNSYSTPIVNEQLNPPAIEFSNPFSLKTPPPIPGVHKQSAILVSKQSELQQILFGDSGLGKNKREEERNNLLIPLSSTLNLA